MLSFGCSPARLRLLLLVLSLGWSGWFLWAAFGRWRFEVFCSFVCGPFVPVELAEQYRRAFDWQTPLMLAALPLAALGFWWLLHSEKFADRLRWQP